MMTTDRDTKQYGQIEIIDGVHVGDPCYDGAHGLDVKMPTGRYTAEVELSDEGMWGTRVSALRIYPENGRFVKGHHIGNVGVDSGQMMIACSDYQKVWGGGEMLSYDRHGEFDYDGACSVTLSAEKGGLLGVRDRMVAVASSTGYGDGGYEVYHDEHSNSLMVEFIPEEDCEECGGDGEVACYECEGGYEHETCTDCGGMGYDPEADEDDCSECDSRGYHEIPCQYCGGDEYTTCYSC